MRTLAGAADAPPPRRPVDGYTFSVGSSTTASVADAVITTCGRLGYTVDPWHESLLRYVYAEREPYRTTAYVGEPVTEIEGGAHASLGCACGVNAAGVVYTDPICRRPPL